MIREYLEPVKDDELVKSQNRVILARAGFHKERPLDFRFRGSARRKLAGLKNLYALR